MQPSETFQKRGKNEDISIQSDCIYTRGRNHIHIILQKHTHTHTHTLSLSLSKYQKYQIKYGFRYFSHGKFRSLFPRTDSNECPIIQPNPWQKPHSLKYTPTKTETGLWKPLYRLMHTSRATFQCASIFVCTFIINKVGSDFSSFFFWRCWSSALRTFKNSKGWVGRGVASNLHSPREVIQLKNWRTCKHLWLLTAPLSREIFLVFILHGKTGYWYDAN